MPKILYIQPIHPAGMEYLAAKPGYAVEIAPDTERETLKRCMADADAVVTRLTEVDAELMSCARHLRAVCKHGVGVGGMMLEPVYRDAVLPPVVFGHPAGQVVGVEIPHDRLRPHLEQLCEMLPDLLMKGGGLHIGHIPDVLADKSVMPLGQAYGVFQLGACAENVGEAGAGNGSRLRIKGNRARRVAARPAKIQRAPSAGQGADNGVVHPDEDVAVME